MDMMAPALRELRDRLAPCFAPVDSEFLAAGAQLGDAIGWLAGIRDGLGDLSAALDRPEVSTAAATLDAAAGEIAALATRLEAEAAAMAALEAPLERIGGCLTALLEVNRGLAQLSVNSAIVSSSIADEGGDTLNFAVEIRSLLKAAGQVMHGYGEAQAAARRELAGATAAHAAFRRQQGPLLRDVAARIRRGIGEVASRQQAVRRAAGTVQERADRVASATGVTVAALQVGDATRQRIEHVVDGLDALAAGLDGAERPWSAGLAPDDRHALARQGMALQAALLQGAGAVFGAEVARISTALGQLGGEARGMVQDGAALFGHAGAAQAGRTSFLSALERDLETASGLLAEAGARRREVDLAMAAIEAMLATLHDGLAAVSGAAVDLRLVGLNAAFRCARLGPRGVALAAIARELRAQAWQMAEGVEALSGAVKEAVAAGAAIRAADGAADALVATTGAMQGSLATLREAGGVMDAAIGRLGEDGRRAADALSAMSAGIAAVAQLTGLLDGAAAELGLRVTGGVEAEPELLQARLGLVHGVPFTMVQEREIARRFGADMPEPEAVEADDLLF